MSKQCSRLTFATVNKNPGYFSFSTASGGIYQIDGSINLEAQVNNPGDVNSCARSGKVQFSWTNLTTNVPAVIVSTGIVYCTQNGSTLTPALQSGLATGVWTPEPGLCSASQPTSGMLSASVYSPGEDVCSNAVCSPDPINLSIGKYTLSYPIIIWPAGTSPEVMEMMARRSVGRFAENVTYVGFGIAGEECQTRVSIRAHKRFYAQDTFVVPDILVAVTDLADNLPPRSGPIVSPEDLPGDVYFAEQAPCPARQFQGGGIHQLQGIAKIVWPRGSSGTRCLIEVTQEFAEGPDRGRAVGGFVIGLRNVAAYEGQVWL